MQYYPILITFHIVFAGMWLLNAIIDYRYRSKILSAEKGLLKNAYINDYLSTTNLVGILSSSGILITGVIMVLMMPHFGFFEFTANHWLVSKQIVFIAIYAVIFAMLIPASKKLRAAENDEEQTGALKKVFSLQTTINVMVVLNFLFALSRHFM
ncbi:MAG: hypothetical protein SCALA702_24260 [Melioribacteraceae bacterium]|nr:MAG: hypothetical protein SCALA702_24260 [Melioribacteraceae bacterium]